MIYIDRYRTDENGNEIRPDDAWFKKAEHKTKIALKEKGKHIADESVYRDTRVKAALEKLFHDKCAYCESPLNPGYDWNVEHFRPKRPIAERPKHPGYYWLVYNWENLFPSCTYCNQRRKDKPTWGDPKTLPAKGKGNSFPLILERTRAMSPKDDIDREETLMLNPTCDDPASYLGFDPTGQVFSLEENRYGEKTIEVFNLYRRRLTRARRKRLQELEACLQALDESGPRDNQKKMALKKEFLKIYAKDEKDYAGMVRHYAETIGIPLD